jgi:diketogulonate reductase-like aldo/keto reductase
VTRISQGRPPGAPVTGLRSRALNSSGVPREELFVTTKLWVQDAPATDNTKRAFEASMSKLGLDYLDLYLIHQPFGDVYGQRRALQDLPVGVEVGHPERGDPALPVLS